jgi:hypothetical protein
MDSPGWVYPFNDAGRYAKHTARRLLVQSIWLRDLSLTERKFCIAWDEDNGTLSFLVEGMKRAKDFCCLGSKRVE